MEFFLYCCGIAVVLYALDSSWFTDTDEVKHKLTVVISQELATRDHRIEVLEHRIKSLEEMINEHKF